MGLTRQYLRYGASAVFGLIASPKGNVAYVPLRGESGRYVAVPACEHVFLWDTRRGEKVRSTRRRGARPPARPPSAPPRAPGAPA